MNRRIKLSDNTGSLFIAIKIDKQDQWEYNDIIIILITLITGDDYGAQR